MKLAKRLAALAAHIPVGSVAADIGTDHARLPVFLIKSGRCGKVIAVELNRGPFQSAAERVSEHCLPKRIDLRMGNGLSVLKPGEAGVIILAGMGGNTIREILAAAPGVLSMTDRLVLQPMADPGDLRRWLAANGWKISDEELVEDRDRIYVIIVAEHGMEYTSNPLLLELGPRLLEKNDPLLGTYLELVINSYRKVSSGLSASRNGTVREKARDLEEKIRMIQEVRKCL